MTLSPASSSGAAATAPSREDLITAALGFVAQTNLQHLMGGNLVPGSQSLRVTPIGLNVGDVVTNICPVVAVVASGAAPTLIKLGLLDSAGNVQAASADLHASALWTTLGLAVAPLSSPFTIVTAGMYYCAYLMNGNFGTANPTFLANGGPGFNYGRVAGKPFPIGLEAAQTDMVGPFTIATAQQGMYFGIT